MNRYIVTPIVLTFFTIVGSTSTVAQQANKPEPQSPAQNLNRQLDRQESANRRRRFRGTTREG